MEPAAFPKEMVFKIKSNYYGHSLVPKHVKWVIIIKFNFKLIFIDILELNNIVWSSYI